MYKNNLPPSNAGNGNKFITPKLALNIMAKLINDKIVTVVP